MTSKGYTFPVLGRLEELIKEKRRNGGKDGFLWFVDNRLTGWNSPVISLSLLKRALGRVNARSLLNEMKWSGLNVAWVNIGTSGAPILRPMDLDKIPEEIDFIRKNIIRDSRADVNAFAGRVFVRATYAVRMILADRRKEAEEKAKPVAQTISVPEPVDDGILDGANVSPGEVYWTSQRQIEAGLGDAAEATFKVRNPPKDLFSRLKKYFISLFRSAYFVKVSYQMPAPDDRGGVWTFTVRLEELRDRAAVA